MSKLHDPALRRILHKVPNVLYRFAEALDDFGEKRIQNFQTRGYDDNTPIWIGYRAVCGRSIKGALSLSLSGLGWRFNGDDFGRYLEICLVEISTAISLLKCKSEEVQGIEETWKNKRKKQEKKGQSPGLKEFSNMPRLPKQNRMPTPQCTPDLL
ncbi:hypothetical protein QJS04_geneDACA023985 [Acorus gramineus]|uniref:Uncharacterized protein n=1 Tax=Acorus gramineus TaxID=55184 RepID=A0AAV9A9J5_ACOGR|nr:hypothetical protein QJS04_geneDACA023985 [Acorus gramineus]